MSKLKPAPPPGPRKRWLFPGGPKGIPDEIIDKLNKEIDEGLANSKLKAHRRLGGTPIAGPAGDYGKFLAVDGMGA
jgi:hypothetical protein